MLQRRRKRKKRSKKRGEEDVRIRRGWGGGGRKKRRRERARTEMSTPWLIVITLYLHERRNRAVEPRCNCKCFERLGPVDRRGHSPRRNDDKETPFRLTVCHDSASRRVSDGKRGKVFCVYERERERKRDGTVRVKRWGATFSAFNDAPP